MAWALQPGTSMDATAPLPEALPRAGESWRDLWTRMAIVGAALVLGYFAMWEIAERTVLAGSDVHLLHLVRGMAGAFLLATWSFLQIRRSRIACDREIQDLVDRLEDRVRARTRELADTREVVLHQEKMASLGVLAAGIAHDLGNPLASLSAELELLEGEDDAARLQESLDVLRRHVARMDRTLREMVAFARRRRDAVTDVSIALAVADSARLVRHDRRWKKVRLDVDVPSDLPYVHMVEDHLVLVLVNLMLNAADAMPGGGTLSIVGRRAGGGVELRVRDTGSGMSPAVLRQALVPMFTTKAAGRGTGLGLAVSSGVVRSVGGTMRIDSTEGLGTEVIIELPGGSGDDG